MSDRDMIEDRQAGEEVTVTWDGKDLAALQLLFAAEPRDHGVPVVEVDADWNLRLFGARIYVGQIITLRCDGTVDLDR